MEDGAHDDLLGSFRARLRTPARRLLMLDYDGTLAPFTTDRDRALPYDCVRALLPRLAAARHLRVVLISGRSVEDLVALLELAVLPEIWGSHGWERRMSDGTYLPPPLEKHTASALKREWSWLTSSYPAHACEKKPASVALHWRGFSDTDTAVMRSHTLRRWLRTPSKEGLEVHEFDGGVELRATGRTKGDAVRALLEETPAPYAAAYLGDDRTDEDAFEALGTHGLSVLVRSEQRPTAAQLRLAPPGELCDFLRMWIPEDEHHDD
jgi:trehalose-phosphatase